MMQTVKRKRTLVKFAVQRTEYRAGVGSLTVWEPITVVVGHDAEGREIVTDCFYCEWLGSYGSVAVQQEADGVIRPARVRLPYVKKLYELLNTRDVRIYKNGIMDDAHTYTLASAADNYVEGNKMLEFQVRKYEVK